MCVDGSHITSFRVLARVARMARELGGARALFRTPARAPPTPAIGSDENEPPDGASDAAGSTPARTGRGAVSRPPLRAIQPPSQPRWLAPTTNKALGARAAGKTPARAGAASTFLGPTKSLRKTGASSTQASRSKVQEAILFWEENRNVQNVLSTLQQDDSHEPAKVENCSDVGFMRNSEDMLCLQLELDVIKTVLVEEIKAHAEATNLHILEAGRQNEAKERELKNATSLIKELESLLADSINESNELKNSFQSPTFLKKRKLSSKLKRIQASLEKSRNLNVRYQRDEASRISLEQKKDEACREVENYAADMIMSLDNQICHLKSQLDQSKIKIQEMDDKVAASLISLNKEKEIAEERKTYAEKKIEEVKLLERSIEDLEITVCSLENEVKLCKEEVELQKRQQEKLEVELLNVKQQLLAVSSSEKAESSLEDRMVDSPDSTRHPRYKNNERLGDQESRRIGQMEVFEKESEISGPDQEGHMSSAITHGRNMGMQPTFEEQMQGSHASSSSDIFKEAADVSLADSHPIQHVRNQIKPNTDAVTRAVELAVEPDPLVEHTEEHGEPSDQYIQDAGQSDVEVAKVHSSDKDYWLESSEFEELRASEKLVQSSANKQHELYGSGADTDRSLPELESEEQVPPSAVEPVVEVLSENELPTVASVRYNDPVNYLAAPSDELKKLRSRNHYEGPRTATDRRFWSIEQQDLYNSIYHESKFFDMKWIEWGHIDSINQFAGVREKFANLRLEQIMSYCCDWDDELIRQFYSTVHITADKSSMTWMTDGRRITTNKRAWEEKYGIPSGVYTEIHSQFLLDDDGKKILHTPAKSLTPLASVANKILRTTVYPRSGSTIHTHNWNILCHIVEQRSFDVIALIFGEIDFFISDRNRSKDLLRYAPYIMGMILGAFEYNGPRESRHPSYRPIYSCNPKQTKKGSHPEARAVAAAFEPPPSAFQPKVAVAGHDAHSEAVDSNHQFEAAGHQPKAEAVQGQAVLAQSITHTDLL